MGQLLYGTPPVALDIDDTSLAHLEAVTVAKLRRNEPFALSVPTPAGGRRTIWLNSASTLIFDLDGPAPELDRERIDRFLDGANSAGGMRLPIE